MKSSFRIQSKTANDILLCNTYVTGSAHAPHGFCNTQQLYSYFALAHSFDEFVEKANALNGEWAIVMQKEKEGDVWMAADHRASKRLYYRIEDNNTLLCADNGFSILKDGDSWNEDALLFFRRWGNTYNGHTLIHEIKKLPEGAAACFSQNKEPRIVRYDTFTNRMQPFDSLIDKPAYSKAMHTLLDYMHQATERLVMRLSGRPVIVPLTAGRDSRLIVTLLKQYGYKDIYAVSYGKPQNKDAFKAEQVARKLNIPFLYINSVDPLRTDYTIDPQFMGYMEYISGLSAGYFYQEFIPSQQLALGITKHATPYPAVDAVVLHGHQGDVSGGSQLLSRKLTQTYKGAWQLAKLVTDYKSNNSCFSANELQRLLHITARYIDENYLTNQPLHRLFEWFHFNENISKYDINSQHSWRYFGFDTAGLFLDKELANYAYALPFSYRYAKRMYEELTDKLFREMGVSFPDDAHIYKLVRSPYFRFKQFIKPAVMPFLPKPSLFKNDLIGFETIMQQVLKKVKSNPAHHPFDSINSLSYEWLIMHISQQLGD